MAQNTPQSLNIADYLAAEAKLTVEEKAALASHLAAGLGPAQGEDFVQAEAVLRLMTWNSEPRVVEAMAKAAAANPNTPRSLAWALANDDEGPATTILEVCAALSDADLVSLVQAGDNAVKMRAIARRPSVSEVVSRSLVDHGDEDTVHTLLANTKAEIPSDAYGTARDRFGQSERIQEGIAGRKAAAAPAMAMPGYTEDRSDGAWAAEMASMIAERSLNEAALVRQLCLGNLTFFAHALAALAKARYADVQTAVLETPPAFAPFWQSAGLSKEWLAVAAAAVTALIQVDHSAGKADPDLFARNIVNRTQANLKAAKVVLTDAQKRFFARPGGMR